ncbi:MAG: radical SAM protein [bacterium]
MRTDREEKALRNLENRIHLCSRSITMPEESNTVLHIQSTLGFGGPRGTTFYVGDAPGDHNSQISLPILPANHYMAKYALPSEWWEHDTLNNEPERKRKILRVKGIRDDIFLERVPIIWKGTLPNGKKMTLISKGKLHPYQTYCVGHLWKCQHIEEDEGCKYCTLSLSVDRLNIPQAMTDDENLMYLKLAMVNNKIRSITLTSGTIESPENTGRELLVLARRIREETGLSVHIQVEPIFNRALLKELSEVADTIGIFLEVFDERVRKQICPGKAKSFTQDEYLKCWELAASYFGRGRVGTSNIIGFDEDYDVVLRGVEKAAKAGALVSTLFLRVGSPKLRNIIPSYIGREEEVLQLHMELGKILVENKVDDASHQRSGCVGCLGCNSTREAILWAREALAQPKPEEVSSEETYPQIPIPVLGHAAR